jgi:hypothetical protein
MNLLMVALLMAGFGSDGESLPGPAIHGHSFEALTNTRYSIHSGFTDSLPVQVMANVLWAMERVPRTGEFRELYVANRDNVYRYDPSVSRLLPHEPGDRRYYSGSAFEVGIACDRHEEAGMMVQAGLLAASAFWDSLGPGVSTCPMKWAADHANSRWNPDNEILMVNVYGGAEVDGPDTTMIAASSDSSLPAPHASGPDTFELVLAGLANDSAFDGPNLSDETVSQLLWSGYGVTPHLTSNGRQGLTVPSAAAGYFLTGHIYLVRDQGVDRYHSRLPGGSPETRDHRLERVHSGDMRPELRDASARIPDRASLYIVVCVDDTTSYRTIQEAGCAGFQYLVQARCLGLAGALTVPLSYPEQAAVRSALRLPADEYPVLVFSTGEPADGTAEKKQPGAVEIVRARPAIRPNERLRVEYLLRRPGQVQIYVHDLLGRPIELLLDERQTAGYHSFVWDGTDASGQRMRRKTVIVSVVSSGTVSQHKVSVF